MRKQNFWTHKNITRTHKLGVKRWRWQLIYVSKLNTHQWKCGLNEHNASSSWESILRKRNEITPSKKIKNATLCQLLVSFSAQCLYWKIRITIVIWARHIGQPASSSATRRAQLSQKHACPHGTNANPWRVAVKHTSQDTCWAGGSDSDEFEADDVVVVAVGTPRCYLLSGAVPQLHTSVGATAESGHARLDALIGTTRDYGTQSLKLWALRCPSGLIAAHASPLPRCFFVPRCPLSRV